MVFVPGGTFIAGSDETDDLRVAVIDDVWMDRALVTNAAYCKFLNAQLRAGIEESVEMYSSSLMDIFAADHCCPR